MTPEIQNTTNRHKSDLKNNTYIALFFNDFSEKKYSDILIF